MNDEHQFIPAQIELFERSAIVDPFNNLNFREVVAASDSAKCGTEQIWVKSRFGESLRDVSFPWMLKVEAQFSPAFNTRLATLQVGLPETNSASYVAADELRVEYTLTDH